MVACLTGYATENGRVHAGNPHGRSGQNRREKNAQHLHDKCGTHERNGYSNEQQKILSTLPPHGVQGDERILLPPREQLGGGDLVPVLLALLLRALPCLGPLLKRGHIRIRRARIGKVCFVSVRVVQPHLVHAFHVCDSEKASVSWGCLGSR